MRCFSYRIQSVSSVYLWRFVQSTVFFIRWFRFNFYHSLLKRNTEKIEPREIGSGKFVWNYSKKNVEFSRVFCCFTLTWNVCVSVFPLFNQTISNRVDLSSKIRFSNTHRKKKKQQVIEIQFYPIVKFPIRIVCLICFYLKVCCCWSFAWLLGSFFRFIKIDCRCFIWCSSDFCRSFVFLFKICLFFFH